MRSEFRVKKMYVKPFWSVSVRYFCAEKRSIIYVTQYRFLCYSLGIAFYEVNVLAGISDAYLVVFLRAFDKISVLKDPIPRGTS